MFDQQRLILGSTLRQHIGGRWAISIVSLLVAAPVGLAASGANVGALQGLRGVAPWLIIGVAGTAVIFAVLGVANVTAFRNRRVKPVPIWWVVALGVVAGMARSVVVVPLSAELGVITFTWSELIIRMLAGAAIGALMLPIGALLSSVVASYVTQRRSLLEELSALEIEHMRLSGESEALRDAVLAELRSEVGEVVESGDPEAARSVSHRIWEQSEDVQLPRVSWRDVLWATVAHNPYPTFGVAGFWAVSAFGSLVIAAGIAAALGQIAFSVLCIAVCFWFGRRMSARFPSASIAILITVVLLVEVTVTFVAPLLFQNDPLRDNLAAMLANAVWIPFLIFMVGAVVSAIRSGDDVVARLRKRVAADQARAAAEEVETARIRKEVAAALHGTVQSQLLAAAAGLNQPRIAQLMRSRPQEGLEAALASVDSTLATDADVTEHMARIRRSWGSLMQVSMVGLEEAQSRDEVIAVTRVIEEALTNAYRHGNASTVDVSVTRDEAGLRVMVIDDGHGPIEDSEPGLGSAVLESLAPGAWTLIRSKDQRTILEVVLADHQT